MNNLEILKALLLHLDLHYNFIDHYRATVFEYNYNTIVVPWQPKKCRINYPQPWALPSDSGQYPSLIMVAKTITYYKVAVLLMKFLK